jgi:YggT family protein
VNIFAILAWLIEAYIWMFMIPYALLSWFRIQPGTTLARIQYFLYRAVDPVLRPVRKIIKPIGGLDLSFLVVILVAEIVLVPFLRR